MKSTPETTEKRGKGVFTFFRNNLLKRSRRFRFLLFIYDVIIYLVAAFLLTYAYAFTRMSANAVISHAVYGFVAIFLCRFVADVYGQIWRYGGMRSYLRLMIADACGFVLYAAMNYLLPFERMPLISIFSVVSTTLLASLTIRMVYYLAFRFSHKDTREGRFFRFLLRAFAGTKAASDSGTECDSVGIAIVGAGRVGVSLADEIYASPSTRNVVCCFIDIDPGKIGRRISGVPVLDEAKVTPDRLKALGVQEIVFAFSEDSPERKKALSERYRDFGLHMMVYDYPTFHSASGKRSLREFTIEELLFRKPIEFAAEETAAYYRGKVVLITGGGGSIGSELSRQIAKMQPKKLILVDVYENGVYDIQQELKTEYGKDLDLSIEILSVCNRPALDRVFAAYRPEIVLNAAAHKHVPLMEHNCCEAVENNVFGTLNTVELCEKYGAERFLMVSTDKAVNPTNVMGATKRMCELIMHCHAQNSKKTVFCATRFGNVLGSAGSVIPLFKKQIARGGPVTVTDKRIIRYFMTIPEASQLVLESGAMAKNGELFVLDMGKPVKILDLAENMIRLSGFEPYRDIEIIETGLRPGEKLYEELLIRSEELSRTSNKLIFIEKDKPLPPEVIEEKLEILREAVKDGSDERVRAALHEVVPTFKPAEVVNRTADQSDEMNGKR